MLDDLGSDPRTHMKSQIPSPSIYNASVPVQNGAKWKAEVEVPEACCAAGKEPRSKVLDMVKKSEANTKRLLSDL